MVVFLVRKNRQGNTVFTTQCFRSSTLSSERLVLCGKAILAASKTRTYFVCPIHSFGESFMRVLRLLAEAVNVSGKAVGFLPVY